MSGGEPAPTPGPGAPEDAGVPAVHVVRGRPTAEEVAALTAVLAALRAARQSRPAPAETRRRADGWLQRSRLLRTPLFPAPGAWRRSSGP